MFRMAILFLSLVASSAFAQDQTVLNQGLSFANSITPSQNGQVVNPGAVNSSAWSSSTSVPSTTPNGMGSFSAPATTSSYGSANVLGGLTSMGTQAMTDCATYVPTGNAVADQRCAAVNFMSAHCLSTSSSQNKILAASAASQSSLANCQGTYGSGSSQFNYANTINSTDSIFNAVANASTSASADTTCNQQTIVTTPAKYSINSCVKSTQVDDPTCNYSLTFHVTDTTVPAGGGGTACPATLSVMSSVSESDGFCIGYYSSSNPYNVQGTDDAYVGGWDCTMFLCSAFVSTQAYTCPAGTTLSGSSCITRSVTSSWSDGCTSLETSAGAMLGAPSP